MTQIFAGATLDRPPGPKYLAALPFAELLFTTGYPKIGTLERWRVTAPGLALSLVAPHGCRHGEAGAFRFDEGLEERFDWFARALEATGASAVIPTGTDLSTGPRDRDRLRVYMDRLRKRMGDRHIVWAPSGLWEDEIAQPFAEELGVLCAFDPLEDMIPEGPIGYARVAAVGARQRLSEGLLYDVLDRVMDGAYDQAFIALETPRSFKDATALHALAAG